MVVLVSEAFGTDFDGFVTDNVWDEDKMGSGLFAACEVTVSDGVGCNMLLTGEKIVGFLSGILDELVVVVSVFLTG